jgi:Domain of unknown function (DUF2017)
MRQQFTSMGRGRAYGEFAVLEADLVRNLVAQVIELVRDESPESVSTPDPIAGIMQQLDGPITPPEDPVLERLLPDAYRDDPEAAGEFRRFTERGLRDEKATNGVRVLESLEEAGLPAQVTADDETTVEVELSPDQVAAWLRTLTDVRLALATRLGVEQDDDNYWEALADDDPRAYLHDIYDWLGFVQESLVVAVS